MQRTLWSGGLVVFLAACSPSGSDKPLEDPLVLELGGANPRIAPALRKQAEQQNRERGPDDESGEPLPPQLESEPRPQPSPRQSFREIALPAGGSLYQLCVDHLGDGSRWVEVAELNGWTEAEVTRLPAGKKVRLPLR